VADLEAGDVLTVAFGGDDSTQGPASEEADLRRLYRELWEKGRRFTPASAESPSSGEASAKSSDHQSDLPKGQALFEELPAPLGRYLVRRKLGRGGMGAVYLAWDTQLERDVALKIPTTGSDQAAADRFLREARAAAALDHPHVCPIYDHGQIDGTPYLTLKLIDGRTLAEVLEAGPLPPREAVEIARRMAEALDAAHRVGVTHRDLKPGNIMLDAAGRPWVMDFGLARRETVDPSWIKEGEVFGTPFYMSPEQAEGQGDRVGAPSDIYSLGVVLYEMLCGRTPFLGGVAKVLEKIRREEPLPPSSCRPEIDSRLDAICLKAMAKQPHDRYATAGDMSAALGRYLHSLPPPMPGLETSALDAAALRRKRIVRWSLTAAAVLLIALLGFLSLGGGRVVVEVARSWTASDPVAGSAPPAGNTGTRAVPPFPEMQAPEQDVAITAEPVTLPEVTMFSPRDGIGADVPRDYPRAGERPPVLLQQTLGRNLDRVRAARAARWLVRFHPTSAEDYLEQLGGMNMEIAFWQTEDRCLYFSDLAGRRLASVRDLAQERRIGFLVDSQVLMEETARLLDAPQLQNMLVFVPSALEEKMLNLELAYRSAREEQVLQTIFQTVPVGDAYDVVVSDQTLRD
jgi:hypothetical protein